MVNLGKVEDKLVVQANTLIEASYKLKPSQQKFLRVMASMINFGDEDFKIYEFKVSELMNLYGIKDQSKYSEIPKQTKELMGNILTFNDDNSEVLVPFLSFYKHEKGEGTIKVQFHPFLKPFYLYLNSGNPFTKYKLKNIVCLKSTYAIRFYELLKQYEGIKTRTFTIEEIRRIFQIGSNEYARYNDFKRKVILKAQKELSLKTDISFEFEEIKTGRKVTSLKFYIHSNKVNKLNDIKINKAIDEVSATVLEDIDVDIIKEVKDIINKSCNKSISDKAANEFYKLASQNKEFNNNPLKLIKEIADYSNTQNIKSFNAWFKTMLKDYEKPDKCHKQLNFNNFTGRGADYYGDPELERKLLGWD